MINSRNKGFTLLETLVAVAIIVIGALGVFSAVAKYSQMTEQERDNLVATYLCQEGIEIVKNIRDTNWIEESAGWKDGISCSSGCQADFDDTTFSAFSSESFLYIDYSNGLYQYLSDPDPDLDVETPYSRKITITEVGDDELDIEVTVYWHASSMTVKENIYNWK